MINRPINSTHGLHALDRSMLTQPAQLDYMHSISIFDFGLVMLASTDCEIPF